MHARQKSDLREPYNVAVYFLKKVLLPNIQKQALFSVSWGLKLERWLQPSISKNSTNRLG